MGEHEVWVDAPDDANYQARNTVWYCPKCGVELLRDDEDWDDRVELAFALNYARNTHVCETEGEQR